ncbi:DDB1- and CUL4-associated factor 4 [Juglans microcarpa x Juglans regia]|uniref:DDB1- and CUL4-associated factor 4 n=1 Tax=Juglans microcarpa x Juglans regia TaxID=2249226 RepID=UPI001B7E7C2E|nr:DDB1- and CUL4-associated factor 4 [Juglans microcarpa x Juglans regia]
MPQHLPGFYYDAQKNRYFPIKGPIPGSSRASSSTTAQELAQKSTRATNLCRRTGVRASNLLQVRELYGNIIPFIKGKCNFKEEFQKIRISQPVVWKFSETDKIADGALEQMHVDVQTPEGQTETDVLLTGGLNGSLSFVEVGKVRPDFDIGVKCMPDRVWPFNKNDQADCGMIPGPICRPARASLSMSSNVSCIKLFEKQPSTIEDGSSIRGALISTLGSETSRGSLNIVKLVEPLDLNSSVSGLNQRIHEVASFNCTIWTADCSFNGSRAAIGTNLGAALVDLETGVGSWVLRSKSDVFAQQFVESGNALLCGLRNGVIVTVDVREKQEGNSVRLISHRIPCSPLSKTVGSSTQKLFKVLGNIDSSCTIKMPSSISCLVSLQYDDHYFLASSMDGSVKLYDHRLIRRGAVQSYEGHVNSHTRIQLAVDASEKFLMSGGEDCNLRLWSIKSGELLFENKFSNSVPSTVCWRRAERLVGVQDERQSYREYPYQQGHGLEAWLGSREGLFYMDWS